MAVSNLNPLSFLFLQNQTPQLPPKNCPSPQLPLVPLKNPSTLSLKTLVIIPNLQPKFAVKTTIKEEQNDRPYHPHHENTYSLSVISPSLAFSNALFFNSPYNVQVVVGENESEEALISRFRREVLKARVLQECKRRRFFESTQEKRKRKSREAAKRNRKWRPPPRKPNQSKAEDTKKKKIQESDDDNWEYFLDIDLPYC